MTVQEAVGRRPSSVRSEVASMKVKRRAVEARHQGLLDQMYAAG